MTPPRNRPNSYGKVWGPGAPGQRLPSIRVTWQREIPHAIVIFGGVLLFILIYMQFLRATPGRSSAALGGDPAPETTRAVAVAAVDSAARARPFQGLLDGAKDGAPLDALDSTKPTDPYRTLMWNLKRYSVAEVTTLSETVSADDLINSPDAWRGRFVRATGKLIKPAELQRLGTNEAGYENRWRGFLLDEDSGSVITFDMFEKPEKEFDRTDEVTVEGVFLQLVSYESRGGSRRVPFLEAKSLRPFAGEHVESSFGSNPTTLLLAGALILASLPVLAYFVSSFLQRRHEADLVQALEKARQRRGAAGLARKAAAGKAPAPAPPDGASPPATAPLASAPPLTETPSAPAPAPPPAAPAPPPAAPPAGDASPPPAAS